MQTLKDWERLKDIQFDGDVISSFTGLSKSNDEKDVYFASYSEKKESLSDNVIYHYKVEWHLKDFFEAESKQLFDWNAPHSFIKLSGKETSKEDIEGNLRYVSNFTAYNKKIAFFTEDNDMEILHRPINRYPSLSSKVIYWALGKNSEGEYYELFWNVINLFEPAFIEMRVNNSRYCVKCLKPWTSYKTRCVDDSGHKFKLNVPLDNVIGVDEASEILGLSPGTIKNYCANGKISAKKIGKTWILDKSTLPKPSN